MTSCMIKILPVYIIHHSYLEEEMSSDDEVEISKICDQSEMNINDKSPLVEVNFDSPTSPTSFTSSSSDSDLSDSLKSILSASHFSKRDLISPPPDSPNNFSLNSSWCGDDSTYKPVFISDGITGDLNSPNIISKCFPGETYQSILDQVIKTCSLNRDIWLSIGNFLPLLADAPCSVFEHPSKRAAYCNTVLNSFRAALESFEKSVKQYGGRLFLVEVFPSPAALNPDASKVPNNFRKLAWYIYLGLNDIIHNLNRKFGHTRTLNFNSYLRHRISMRKGKVRSFNKSVFEISSEESGDGQVRDRRQESKLKEGLHHSNGFSLLEPTRLVIADIISRAILGS